MKRTNLQNRTLSGLDLKWIACFAMLADHIAKRFSLQGASFLVLSDLIGRIAFPIYCMLLAEGFFHTRSRARYLQRMLLLALVSEVPFDLVFSSCPVDWSLQNTCFTLLLGLMMFALLHRVCAAQQTDYRIILVLQLLIIAAFAAAAALLRTDYGAGGIATLAVCYFGCAPADEKRNFDDTQKRGTAAAAACLCLNIWRFQNAGAFLSLIPLSRYDGTRRHGAGRAARWAQNFFYLFYPTHLCVLYLIFILR